MFNVPKKENGLHHYMNNTKLAVLALIFIAALTGCTLTPHHAIAQNNVGYLKSLSNEELSKGVFGNDWLPVHVASAQGNVEALKILIEKGVNLDSRTAFGNHKGATPLQLAVLNNHTKAVELLLDAGAIVNYGDRQGVTPLEVAITNQNKAAVTILLNRGARPNNPNTNGVTPIFAAIQRNDTELINLLLVAGADINFSTPNLVTPLIDSAANEQVTFKITDQLISNGADLDKTTDQGDTALYWAVARNNYLKASHLISAGANPNIASENRFSPLHLAAINKNVSLVKELLAANANPNIRGVNLTTPLHEAAFSGDVEIVQILLDAGASIDSGNSKGFTAIQFADFQGHRSVVDVLVRNGADPNFQPLVVPAQVPQTAVVNNSSGNSNLWAAALVGIMNAVGNYYGVKNGYSPAPIAYVPPVTSSPAPVRQPVLQYTPLESNKAPQVHQPSYSAPLVRNGCVSDLECGGSLKCVKPPLSTTGQCIQPVNNFGTPVNTLPNPSSALPNLNTKGQCQFDTQCPVSFECNQELKVCVQK